MNPHKVLIHALLISVSTAALLLGGYVLISRENREIWLRESREVQAVIEQLKNSPPPDCEQERWETCVYRVHAGFVNGCHSPDTTTLFELRELKNDLQKMSGNSRPSTKLLRELWERIGSTNDASAELTKRHRIDLEDVLTGMCEGKAASQ